MKAETPLGRLIRTRSRELALTAESLGLRLGYQNPAKAAGRVQALCDGQLTRSRFALFRLASALEISPATVQAAVKATEELLEKRARDRREQETTALEAANKVWRSDFRPHAILLTANTRPSSIVLCGITGGADRWLRVELDLSRPPITFVRQVLDALPRRLEPVAGGKLGVRFFGEGLGFVVNYSPDNAVRFDLAGEAVEVLSGAYRSGTVEMSFGRRKASPRTAATLVGLGDSP